jgi:hypothetical protein
MQPGEQNRVYTYRTFWGLGGAAITAIVPAMFLYQAYLSGWDFAYMPFLILLVPAPLYPLLYVLFARIVITPTELVYTNPLGLTRRLQLDEISALPTSTLGSGRRWRSVRTSDGVVSYNYSIQRFNELTELLTSIARKNAHRERLEKAGGFAD